MNTHVSPKNPNKKGRKSHKTKGRQLDEVALAEVDALIGDVSRSRDLLIEHLHKIQDNFGCLESRVGAEVVIFTCLESRVGGVSIGCGGG